MKLLVLFFFLLFILSFKSIYHIEDPQPYILKYDTTKFKKPIIPEDNLMTVEGVALGRLLFYDKILSVNNQVSCGTCHKQELAFTDGKKNAEGVYGRVIDRNSMTLTNLAWQDRFFWDGKAKTLEDLVFFPITNHNEMDSDTSKLVSKLQAHNYYPIYFNKTFNSKKITFKNVSRAIAQFLRTIVSNGANLPDTVIPALDKREKFTNADTLNKVLHENSFMGMYIRFSNMCASCHTAELPEGVIFATNLIDSIVPDGLYKYTKDTTDKGHFKAPSFINMSLTAPYMHDGRFATLSEVIEHYDKNLHKLPPKNPTKPDLEKKSLITEYDKLNLEKFLMLFIDSTLIKNKELSDPFINSNFNWDNYPNFK